MALTATVTHTETDVAQVVVDGLTKRELGNVILAGLKALGVITLTPEQDALLTEGMDYDAPENDNEYIAFDGASGISLMPASGSVKYVRRNTEVS